MLAICSYTANYVRISSADYDIAWSVLGVTWLCVLMAYLMKKIPEVATQLHMLIFYTRVLFMPEFNIKLN